MLVVNTEYIEGYELEMLGVVKGGIVQSKNAIRDFGAGLKTIVGGRYAGACLLFFMLILALMLKMMLIAMRILSFGLREAVKCGKI